MRFHYRTGKRSSVSVGVGLVLVGWLLLASVIALPVYLIGMVFGIEEHSTAWGVVMLVWVAIVVAANCHGR